MLLYPVILTRCPSATLNEETASQLAPLNMTLPTLPGPKAAITTASLPTYSSSRSPSDNFLSIYLFFSAFLSNANEANELSRKIKSCVLKLTSKNRHVNAVTQAPTPKNISTKPGTTNSSRMRTRPIRNHITSLCWKKSAN